MKRLVHIDVYNAVEQGVPIKIVALTFAPERKTPRSIIGFRLPLGCTMKDAAKAMSDAVYQCGRRDS